MDTQTLSYLPRSYRKNRVWSTIDVEAVEDANFGITSKRELVLDYERAIDTWLECNPHGGYAFVLGSFAKKYPHIVKKIAAQGIEIGSHGLYHHLVYRQSFQEWFEQLQTSKKILEDMTGQEVRGYRSPSWSLPFEKRYYEALIELGFSFSSSYFPFKTYMYGHSEDKKKPFIVKTSQGDIGEIPIPKLLIPFSGGFYLRVLPSFFIAFLAKQLLQKGVKPVFYIHPYELISDCLICRFSSSVVVDKAFLLSFIHLSSPRKKLCHLLKRFS